MVYYVKNDVGITLSNLLSSFALSLCFEIALVVCCPAYFAVGNHFQSHICISTGVESNSFQWSNLTRKYEEKKVCL